LIVSQYGQSNHRPHRACPRSPRGPPRAPQALGESTPEGAPPDAVSLLPEPDSPLAARPLVQLGLEVVDIALGSNQLILSMLQLGTGVIEVISLEIVAAISPHQLLIQLPDARLQAGVLLQKLSVALLDALDDAVLGLHLIGALSRRRRR
jgi:hypothetical protein